MGEGVSPSVPRKGFPGADLLSSVVSVPFVLSGIKSSLKRSDDCGALTKNGLPTQKGVSPSLTQKWVADAGSSFPAGLRGVVSSGNHESSEIITTNDTIDAAVAISGIVGITENVDAIIEAAGDVSDDAVKAIDADLGSISGIQCNATLISIPGRSEMGVQPDVLSMCSGDAEDIKRSGKAMVCAVSSTVCSTDSGVKSLDLQGNDLRSSVPCRSEYDVRPRKAVSDFGGVEFSPLRSGSENVRGVMGMSYGDIETLAKKGSVGNGFRQSDMQIKHVCGQPYRKGDYLSLPQNRDTYNGVHIPGATSSGTDKMVSNQISGGSVRVIKDAADSTDSNVTTNKGDAVSFNLHDPAPTRSRPVISDRDVRRTPSVLDLGAWTSRQSVWVGMKVRSVVKQRPFRKETVRFRVHDGVLRKFLESGTGSSILKIFAM